MIGAIVVSVAAWIAGLVLIGATIAGVAWIAAAIWKSVNK